LGNGRWRERREECWRRKVKIAREAEGRRERNDKVESGDGARGWSKEASDRWMAPGV